MLTNHFAQKLEKFPMRHNYKVWTNTVNTNTMLSKRWSSVISFDAYWAINAKIRVAERFSQLFSLTISTEGMQAHKELFAQVFWCAMKLWDCAARIRLLQHCLYAQVQVQYCASTEHGLWGYGTKFHGHSMVHLRVQPVFYFSLNSSQKRKI